MNIKSLKAIPEDNPCEFNIHVVLKKVASKTARNGSEYLQVEVGDRTGSFAFTCFSNAPVFEFFKNTPESSFITINGITDYYQSRFNPKINEAVKIDDLAAMDSTLIANLIEMPPENPQELWQELQGYIAAIQHESLRKTVFQALDECKDAFYICPAAKAMHHAYQHGLLEHTTHVTRAGRALLPLYQEVDPDLATAGLILHDIGKIIEYEASHISKRTKTGILHGHVVLGYRIARKAGIQNKLDPELLERLEHIILSHQGELEWGAAVMAGTPEAVFVSLVDNLDAKMGMVQQVLRNSPDSDDFSDYLPGLKSPLLLKPLPMQVAPVVEQVEQAELDVVG